MSQIKYLVMGADRTEINKILGTLINGEMEGDKEIVVSPMVVPRVFTVGPNASMSEIKFETFLAETVRAERRKLIEKSAGEKAVKDVVKQLNANQGKGAQPGPAQAANRAVNRSRAKKSGR